MPEWPSRQLPEGIDVRAPKKMLMVNGYRDQSCRLWRPYKSVHGASGVCIETHDDTARVYPCRLGEGGSGVVERRVSAIEQKTVSIAGSIGVNPNDAAFGISPASKGKRTTRIINGRIRPVESHVTLALCGTCGSTDVCGSTNDCARGEHDAATTADCAGWIEGRREYAFLGHQKTVGDISSGKDAAGWVGTGSPPTFHPMG